MDRSRSDLGDGEIHGSTVYFPETAMLVINVRRKGRKKPLTTAYRVEVLQPDPAVGSPAVRLVLDLGGSSYDLIQGEFGWTCECPWFQHHCQDAGRLCKHLKAVFAGRVLEQMGLRG